MLHRRSHDRVFLRRRAYGRCLVRRQRDGAVPPTVGGTAPCGPVPAGGVGAYRDRCLDGSLGPLRRILPVPGLVRVLVGRVGRTVGRDRPRPRSPAEPVGAVPPTKSTTAPVAAFTTTVRRSATATGRRRRCTGRRYWRRKPSTAARSPASSPGRGGAAAADSNRLSPRTSGPAGWPVSNCSACRAVGRRGLRGRSVRMTLTQASRSPIALHPPSAAPTVPPATVPVLRCARRAGAARAAPRPVPRRAAYAAPPLFRRRPAPRRPAAAPAP